jgi:hypothetical protein
MKKRSLAICIPIIVTVFALSATVQKMDAPVLITALIASAIVCSLAVWAGLKQAERKFKESYVLLWDSVIDIYFENKRVVAQKNQFTFKDGGKDTVMSLPGGKKLMAIPHSAYPTLLQALSRLKSEPAGAGQPDNPPVKL